jgi:hypothetical protein
MHNIQIYVPQSTLNLCDDQFMSGMFSAKSWKQYKYQWLNIR